MLPFQYLFIASAALWGLSQIIPTNPIQTKMQGTSALIMMMIGLTITGIITIPQFEPEKPLRYLEPQQAVYRNIDVPKVAKAPKTDLFGPDDLDRDIQRMGKY